MAKITIGADPEFGFLRADGTLVSPGSVINDTLSDRFGIDGSRRVAELRPDYSSSPAGLVDTIKQILQRGYDTNQASHHLVWKAGSVAGEEPIGGHVHLGHSTLAAHGQVCDDLGVALAKVVSPVVAMAEDREEAILRRVGSNYGTIDGENCMRLQAHGIEYRTLPSWLTSPQDALSVLTLCYVVGSNFDNADFMNAAMALPEVDSEFFSDCNKRAMVFYLQDIAKVLKKANGFKEMLPAMAPMFDLIIKSKSFDVDQDMKQSWGLKLKKEAAVNV